MYRIGVIGIPEGEEIKGTEAPNQKGQILNKLC